MKNADESIPTGSAGVAVPAHARARLGPKVIGQAMQQAHERAIAADPPLRRADWRVLSALQSLTLAYHRLTDRISIPQLCDASRLGSSQVYAALANLEAAGVIVRQSGGGRRRVSLLGFPGAGETLRTGTEGSGVETLHTVPDGLESETLRGLAAKPSAPGRTPPVKTPPGETPGVLGGGKSLPQKTEAKKGGHADPEPPEFTVLLARIERASGETIEPPGRGLILTAWRENPEGTERQVADVIRGRGKPGRLISRIRCGAHLRTVSDQAPAAWARHWRNHILAGEWCRDSPSIEVALADLRDDLVAGEPFGKVSELELAELMRVAETVARAADTLEAAQVAGGRQ